MFVKDRDSSRRTFIDVWRKHNEKTVMDPLELLILDVILEHPEYHRYLENEDKAINYEPNRQAGESNPFLHMGMHIALREQVQNNRPPGVRDIYLQLIDKKFTSQHELEHLMMECFGRMMWEAQLNNCAPDFIKYLDCIKMLK